MISKNRNGILKTEEMILRILILAKHGLFYSCQCLLKILGTVFLKIMANIFNIKFLINKGYFVIIITITVR